MDPTAQINPPIFALPLELWEESLLPRMSRHTVVQLSMTCHAMRVVLSRRAFESIRKPMPTFAPGGAAGHAPAHGRKALVRVLAEDFAMFAACPAATHVRTLHLAEVRPLSTVDTCFYAAALGPRTWSGLAVELVLPHLSNFSVLKKLILSRLTLTHKGVCAVLSLVGLEALSLRQCMLDLGASLPREQPAKLRSFHWNGDTSTPHFNDLLTAVITDSLDELRLYCVDNMILEALQHAAPLTAVTTLSLEMAHPIPVDLISFLPTVFPNVAYLRIDDWSLLPLESELEVPCYFPLVPGSFARLDHIDTTRAFYIELILDLHPITRIRFTPLIGRDCEDFVKIASQRASLQRKLTFLRLVFHPRYIADWSATIAGILLQCRALEVFECHVYLPPSSSDSALNDLLDTCAQSTMPSAIRKITVTLESPAPCLTALIDRCTLLLRRVCTCARLEYFMIEARTREGRCAYTYDRAVFGQLLLDTVEKQYGVSHEHDF